MPGPKDLPCNEMAQVLSEVLGRPVHFFEMSSDSMKSGLREYGQSEAMAQGVVDTYSATRDGIYSHEWHPSGSASSTTFLD